MNYAVLEEFGEWIVQHEGAEVARFPEQEEALADIAERLRENPGGPGSYSLCVRYQPRG